MDGFAPKKKLIMLIFFAIKKNLIVVLMKVKLRLFYWFANLLYSAKFLWVIYVTKLGQFKLVKFVIHLSWCYLFLIIYRSKIAICAKYYKFFHFDYFTFINYLHSLIFAYIRHIKLLNNRKCLKNLMKRK